MIKLVASIIPEDDNRHRYFKIILQSIFDLAADY